MGEELFSSDPVSYKMDRRSPEAFALRDAVNRKLYDFMGNYTDKVLAEYIVVLVCNDKHQNQARNDLEAFLGDDSGKFVAWLWDHLAKENYASRTLMDSSTLKAEVACSEEDVSNKQQKSSSLPDHHINASGMSDIPLPKDGRYDPSYYSTNSNCSKVIEISESVLRRRPSVNDALTEENNQILQAHLNEVNAERLQAEPMIVNKTSGAADHSGATKHFSSIVRCSPSGDEQLPDEYQHQKIAKIDSSALLHRPLPIPRTEPVARGLRSIITEDQQPRPAPMRNSAKIRLLSAAVDSAPHQIARPRGNVWDRLGKPSTDDYGENRGKKNLHDNNLIKRGLPECQGEELQNPRSMWIKQNARLSSDFVEESVGLGSRKLEHSSNNTADFSHVNNSKRKRLYSESNSGNSPSFSGCNRTLALTLNGSIDEVSLEPMEGAAVTLPRASDLSPSLLHFLSSTFESKDDLLRSADLESDLRSRCANLDALLSDLGRRLSDSVVSYASHSDQVASALGGVRSGLQDLGSSVSRPDSDGLGRSEQILAEELPALAKEVARVETVRAYAETTLKLDSLIGDVEDAVSSSVTTKLKSPPNSVVSEESWVIAINSFKQIEDILTSVAKTRPQWSRLVSAVDHRVDRALAVLRPQAISDHRSLLSSLGWPPALSGSSSLSTLNSGSKQAKISNPLFTMGGDLKSKYCESFLSLCHLQELQSRRKSRQLEGHNLAMSALRQPLWVIEELVTPISIGSQRHFSKWVDKPELIFALVYKITRDFIDSMDEVLQPLVDKARLVGYSCREEWISAMVTSLCTYLAKEIFPKYVDLLQDDSRTSFLHLVDQMISFDKRTLTLITNSGLLLSLREDENLQRVSVLSVFCDRPDWLDIWAEIECGEMLEKLKSAIQVEKSWNTRLQGTMLVTGSEDYKSPAVSGILVQYLSTMVDRSRPLPSILLRASFIRLAGAPLVREFLDCLFRRCQEAEGLTALADDDALIKVSNSINAARYCESTLSEWLEDVFFLEMESDGKSIFNEEIRGLREFQTEWVEKVSTVVLRGFQAQCRDYFRNKRQWQDKAEGGWAMSKAFVGALDYLQGKVSKLEENLNEMDFVTVWRSVAVGVDGMVFGGVLMGGGKFHDGGVERFGGDLEVLFGVFGKWCLRPQGFFPRLSEGLRLLKMEEGEAKEVMARGKEGWLREKGMRHLSLGEAEKIVKNRVFM